MVIKLIVVFHDVRWTFIHLLFEMFAEFAQILKNDLKIFWDLIFKALSQQFLGCFFRMNLDLLSSIFL
jgi:hypothetical protein